MDLIEAAFLTLCRTNEDVGKAFIRTPERVRSNQVVILSELHQRERQRYKENTNMSQLKQFYSLPGLCKQENCVTNVSRFVRFRYILRGKATVGTESGGSNIFQYV